MIQFEYVVSGPSYIRLGYPESSMPEFTDIFLDKFTYLKNKSVDYNHEFSILYNAYTEKNLGDVIFNNFRSGFNNIYADSGGLQIITQGKSISREMKMEVYKNQLAYSDFGMCFDEIPLKIFGSGKSKRGDTNNRLFDTKNIKEFAVATANNVIDQINAYVNNGSETKPILIMHGNCYATFMEWYDSVMTAIPDNKRKYISGIALSGASIGTGLLEDVERAFFFSQIKNDIQHLHLLGLGSTSRAHPFLVFQQTGLLDGVKISYDSTTHSSAPHMGRYFIKDKALNFSREFDYKFEIVYNDIQSKFDMGLTIEEFHKAMVTPARQLDKIGNTFSAFTGAIVSSIENFMIDLNNLRFDEDLKYKIDKNLIGLYNVKTKEDFDMWMREVGRFVPSKRISARTVIALDSFFN